MPALVVLVVTGYRLAPVWAAVRSLATVQAEGGDVEQGTDKAPASEEVAGAWQD
eukprot:CAMPEP_0180678304 /NCGR_PEP_ID=MMETSP1037_2-20121125/68309_1 /TAXON_ID=632150 /ORGANISM="Azadinium spinosum, Strain 3D9" /LENGTH=53 /DNA_ID=CAMNT_0022707935 /DNA_START=65 /DNA_END=223 /DNA_ORIENTATION=-